VTRPLVIAVVILATILGAGTALSTFHLDRDLDVGSVRLSIEPARHGALDLYVPLVDWGVRFPVVRLPARVNVDVRSIDRDVVVKLAAAGTLDVRHVRGQARDALASYLRLAIAFATLGALVLGLLVALAARGGRGPRLRTTIATAIATALAIGAALVVLLPPRSNVGSPQYYANGPEVPAALRTLQSLGASSRTLDDELDEQLVGIARLVNAPANRVPLGPRLPHLTVASDLHNNVIALPALERAARGSPLLFAGDLTDRGTPLERALVLRIVHAGSRLVFVSGNHDSDVLERQLARAGALVLTRAGRLNADGTTGALVSTVAGLRIAGYDDPLKRLARDGYADNGATPTEPERQAFTTWLDGLIGRVDVVMVHEPALAQEAVDMLRAHPPAAPLLVVWGHTHAVELRHDATLTTLNAGSVGAGGTGNLAQSGGDIGLARLIYRTAPRFEPLAADLIQIDPADGSAQAERHRLDEPAPKAG
jgi:predicted phosphodiesterase